MTVSPVPAAAENASAQPAVESWSVSATVPSPAARAAVISCAGVSVPSETLLCVCRSMAPGIL
jgi:hypothetical protein